HCPRHRCYPIPTHCARSDLHWFPTRPSSDLQDLNALLIPDLSSYEKEHLTDLILSQWEFHLAEKAYPLEVVYGILPPCYHVYLPDRKSTRLNSSHVKLSYAVFFLKNKAVR